MLRQRGTGVNDVEALRQCVARLRGNLNVTRGVVDAIFCDGTGMTDDDLLSLPGLSSVGLLYLHGTAVTDRGLACLEKFPNLDTLDLSKTAVDGSGIPPATLRGLRVLELSRSGVTDASVSFLSDCQSLLRLGLNRTAITDAALVHIGRVASLKWLNLDRTGVSDEGLPLLSGLTRLVSLEVGRTRCTDVGWTLLQERHLPSLLRYPFVRYDLRPEYD